MAPSACLYALTSAAPSHSDDTFNTWYDNVHAPSRARCPGVQHVARWVATDYERPVWLATYELNDVAALQTNEYKQARKNDGDDETTMFSDLSRRVYTLLSDKKANGHDEYRTSGKSRSLTHMALEPRKGSDVTDAEFNKWYEEEHIPLLSRCPGWLRSTRWRLDDEMDPRTGEKHTDTTAKFLACHEWEDADTVFSSEEFARAVSTPWRAKIMGNIDQTTQERRFFQLWRQFLPDGTSVKAKTKQSSIRSWSDVKSVPSTGARDGQADGSGKTS